MPPFTNRLHHDARVREESVGRRARLAVAVYGQRVGDVRQIGGHGDGLHADPSADVEVDRVPAWGGVGLLYGRPQGARPAAARGKKAAPRSEEHTSELQSRQYLVCRLLLEKNNIL